MSQQNKTLWLRMHLCHKQLTTSVEWKWKRLRTQTFYVSSQTWSPLLLHLLFHALFHLSPGMCFCNMLNVSHALIHTSHLVLSCIDLHRVSLVLILSTSAHLCVSVIAESNLVYSVSLCLFCLLVKVSHFQVWLINIKTTDVIFLPVEDLWKPVFSLNC